MFCKLRAKCGSMDVSMVLLLNSLKQKNQRLKNTCLEEKFNAEILAKAPEKKGEVISTAKNSVSPA